MLNISALLLCPVHMLVVESNTTAVTSGYLLQDGRQLGVVVVLELQLGGEGDGGGRQEQHRRPAPPPSLAWLLAAACWWRW